MTKLVEAMKDFEKNVRTPGLIKFPIKVKSIEPLSALHSGSEQVGAWVSVRPVGDEKTYLGVYLGDLIIETNYYYQLKQKSLKLMPHTNPAIWVPDLNKVVWGCGSWWGIISTPEQLRTITDADIQDIWYVKALKDLSAMSHPEKTA